MIAAILCMRLFLVVLQCVPAHVEVILNTENITIQSMISVVEKTLSNRGGSSIS